MISTNKIHVTFRANLEKVLLENTCGHDRLKTFAKRDFPARHSREDNAVLDLMVLENAVKVI